MTDAIAMRPLTPQWTADAGRVGALMSTREGGLSPAPWASFNLGIAVGDDPQRVAAHRAAFGQAMGGAWPVFLKQVHGAKVVRLSAADTRPDAPTHEADASFTTEAGIACTVQVADCLPVLFAAPVGLGVAAAHAGWRGLAGGVLDATVARLCEVAGCAPAELSAWLGPCIGPRQFEVGEDVLRAFDGDPQDTSRWQARQHADGRPRWLANLPQLARDRLSRLGLSQISGGAWCTVEDRSRFFSYRRDGVTGRLAAAVWLRR